MQCSRDLTDSEVEQVQDALSEAGPVVTLRFVDTQLLATFAASTQALAALRLSPLKV